MKKHNSSEDKNTILILIIRIMVTRVATLSTGVERVGTIVRGAKGVIREISTIITPTVLLRLLPRRTCSATMQQALQGQRNAG